MSYSPTEVAASGDAVRAFHALVSAYGAGLRLIEVGPSARVGTALWRVVLASRALTVWAHGMRNGTLTLALRHDEVHLVLDVARTVAPASLGAGEVRVSSLRPSEAAELVHRVVVATRGRVA